MGQTCTKNIWDTFVSAERNRFSVLLLSLYTCWPEAGLLPFPLKPWRTECPPSLSIHKPVAHISLVRAYWFVCRQDTQRTLVAQAHVLAPPGRSACGCQIPRSPHLLRKHDTGTFKRMRIQPKGQSPFMRAMLACATPSTQQARGRQAGCTDRQSKVYRDDGKISVASFHVL
mmetsp:Transcript_4164/g.6718  ORF Transcript_4164/g.6718 Transcript_4164/m.6718 type:complete len:172 (-) Transcript_4164:30-545(-)